MAAGCCSSPPRGENENGRWGPRRHAQSLGAPGAEAGVWLEVGLYLLWERGTRRALWLSFQFPRCPPPCAGGNAAPRANAGRLANLKVRARSRSELPELWESGVDPKSKFTFSNSSLSRSSFRDPCCFSANLAPLAPGCCVILLWGRKDSGRNGWRVGPWGPGKLLFPRLPSHQHLPVFSSCTFPGLARPARTCPRPLGSAPGL